MSESADRATRRDLRRAMGAEALKVLNDQDAALVHHTKLLSDILTTLRQQDQRLNAQSDRIAAVRAQLDGFERLSFMARLRWLLRGHA